MSSSQGPQWAMPKLNPSIRSHTDLTGNDHSRLSFVKTDLNFSWQWQPEDQILTPPTALVFKLASKGKGPARRTSSSSGILAGPSLTRPARGPNVETTNMAGRQLPTVSVSMPSFNANSPYEKIISAIINRIKTKVSSCGFWRIGVAHESSPSPSTSTASMQYRHIGQCARAGRGFQPGCDHPGAFGSPSPGPYHHDPLRYAQ